MDRKTTKPLTTPQVAKLAGISARTLYRWLDDRLIQEPNVRVGRDVRLWNADDVRKVLEFKNTMRKKHSAIVQRMTKRVGSKPVLSAELTSKAESMMVGPALPELTYRGRFVGLAGMETRTDAPEQMTLKQLADMLRLRPSELYNLTRNRTATKWGTVLPHRRAANGRLLFDWPDVVKWIHEQEAHNRQK